MYTERILFFIDILGFGKKVEKAAKDKALMVKILDCLQKIEAYSNNNKSARPYFYELIKGGGLPDSDFQVLTFSDSLVASVSCKQPEAAALLCMEIQNLQYELMKAGLLVRGAGHVGELIHKQNGVMFGPAFNYAYHLETKVADKPRILLSKKLLDYIINISDTTVDDLMGNGVFTVFPDGPYGIDTYQWVRPSLDPNVDNYQITTLNSLLTAVNQEIDENRDQPEIYTKLIWHKNMMVERILSDHNYNKFKNDIID